MTRMVAVVLAAFIWLVVTRVLADQPRSATAGFAAPLMPRAVPAQATAGVAVGPDPTLRAALDRSQAAVAALQAQLDTAQARIRELEAQLAPIAAKSTKRLYLVDRKVYAEGWPRTDGGWDVTIDGKTSAVYPAPGPVPDP